MNTDKEYIDLTAASDKLPHVEISRKRKAETQFDEAAVAALDDSDSDSEADDEEEEEMILSEEELGALYREYVETWTGYGLPALKLLSFDEWKVLTCD